MTTDNVEKQLRNEVNFWREYIDRNLGQEDLLIPRMYEALDFAQQRLDAYIASQAGDIDNK